MRLLTLHKVHTQVVALSTHKLSIATMVCSTRGHKDRSCVAGAKGLEGIELAMEIVSNLREEQLAVDIDLWHENLWVDILLNVVVETLGECLDILLLHRQTCGVLVATNVLQQIGARLYSLVEVETWHRACRASNKAIRLGEHHRWTVVGLDKS